jgi:zinc transport system ATP-binding protein
VIKAENLFFSYTGVKPYTLNGVNLEIKNGEYVSVVGDNGSGKSTLIKLILKLLKPTSGSIATDAHKIGYVPQKNDFAFSGFPITVYEMLDSYRKLMKIKSKTAVTDALNQVGLTDYSGALIGTLSGGQSQKAFIARALMGNPELLILDEPSTGVDTGSQREIYGIIRRLSKEQGMTIVSVEHNLTAAISNSSLIYHLSGGHGHICTPDQYVVEYTGIINQSGRSDMNA